MAGELDSVLAESDRIDAFADQIRHSWPLATLFVSVCRFLHWLLAAELTAPTPRGAGWKPRSRTRCRSRAAIWNEALGLVALTVGAAL